MAGFDSLPNPVLSLSPTVFAKPSAPQFWTDNAALNEKIQKGQVTISDYHEPSPAQKGKLNKQLIALGYPPASLAAMPWPVKEMIAEKQIPYSKNEPGKAQVRSEEPNYQEQSGAQVMSSSGYLDADGWLNWSFAVNQIQDPTNIIFEMTSWWDWNRMPEFRLTDKIGWAWGGDQDFGQVTSSIQNTQYYYGCGTSSCRSIRVEWNYVAEGYPNSGQATEMDILGNFWRDGALYNVTDMWGYASLRVQRPKNYGSTNYLQTFLSRYYHREGSCTNFEIGFATGETPSMTMSCTFQLGYSVTTDTNAVKLMTYAD